MIAQLSPPTLTDCFVLLPKVAAPAHYQLRSVRSAAALIITAA